MLARIRRSIEDNDEGFTLIELLVVIIIIGILAAIAIPVFLNQRKKGYEASMKSDLRTVATEEETYFTDNQMYTIPTGGTISGIGTSAPATGQGTVSIGTDNVTLSSGNFLDTTVTKTTTFGNNGFCMMMSSSKTTAKWVYDSTKGGLQAAGTTTCTGSY